MNLTLETNYLFDTTLFIDLLRNHATARSIVHQVRFSGVSAGYSVITEIELWTGIKGMRTEQQHIHLLKPFKRYFINVTVARRAGQLQRLLNDKLHENDRPGLPDTIIAATAEFYGLTLCTRNWKHFQHFQQFSISVERYT